MKCGDCGGDPARAQGCAACRGRGVELVTACPSASTPDEVWDAMRLVELAEVALPVAGGWLSQTAAFLQAARFVRAEDARSRKAKLALLDGG